MGTMSAQANLQLLNKECELNMKDFKLTGNNLSKSFIRNRFIFRDISISLSNSKMISIGGENGSGKTTMLKILSGIIPPTSGLVTLEIDGSVIPKDKISENIGFVSPYLILYEEFSPIEHLQLFAKFHSLTFDMDWAISMLKSFNLEKRRNDQIKTFSSGMKQRVKYLVALQHKPDLLFLDEPFTNLDKAGIDRVIEIAQNHRDIGGGVIIASNDEREKALCSETVILTA